MALQGAVSGLEVGAVLDGQNGRLAADLSVALSRDAVVIGVTDLAGTIDGRAVAGAAHVRGVPGGAWTLDDAALSVGVNRLDLRGSWEAGLIAVVGGVAAPDLEQLGVGAQGALEGEIALSGRWPEFTGSVRARSPSLSLQGLEIGSLVVDASFQGQRLSARIDAARLVVGQVAFADLVLSAAGAPADLDWQLRWTGGESRGRLRASSDAASAEIALLEFVWQGRQFATEAPIVARSVPDAVEVGPFCVSGPDTRACLASFGVNGGRVTIAGTLERVPVGLIQAFVAVPIDATGFVEGSWNIVGSTGDWAGALQLAARDLAFSLPDDEEERYEVTDFRVDGTLTGAGFAATLHAAGPGLVLEGDAVLASIEKDGALSGNLTVTMDSIEWLESLDERLRDVGGALEGRFTVGGTLAAPLPQGALRLRQGRLVLENPDLRLSSVELTMQVDPQGGFSFVGHGEHENGRLVLEGQGAGLLAGDLAVNATLRGEHVLATHPQWEVELEPDLALDYRDGVARLSGVLALPRADVRLNTLPNSVAQPSPDVIVIGREAEPVDDGLGRLRIDVRVRLGDQVRLRALGVDIGLRGEVTVRRDAQGRNSVRGTLAVTGGMVAAQGQNLRIESGTVVYNGPVTNPFVDLRAAREFPDEKPPVKVGLHVTGTARRLTSTIYSEPPMADDRALGFLVLGRDIGEQSEADSSQLVAAAINLGISQSSSIIGGLQRASGLDELSAVAEGQDSFALAAGKRIGDDLYLRYTYNTLTAVGAILISFDITDRWRLEALSGEEASMDLLFRLDR